MIDITPSIFGISLRNTEVIQNAEHIKRVKGDVYKDDVCIGYYNPISKNPGDYFSKPFLRIEKQYESVVSEFEDYIPISNHIYTEEIDEGINGFESLLSDLERLNWLSKFIIELTERKNKSKKRIDNFGGLVGIINGDIVKVVCLKNDASNEEIVKILDEKAESFSLNRNYKILIFRKPEDFIIKKCILSV